MARALLVAVLALLAGRPAVAAVTHIEIARQDDFGTYDRVIARVYFAVDPRLPANRDIPDIEHAPTNDFGRVEFASDLVFLRPKPGRANGAVLIEPVNRGLEQSLFVFSGAQQRDRAPASWTLGDNFLLDQGFTLAFFGWQFDVSREDGLAFDAPTAPVRGVVREAYIELKRDERIIDFSLKYCADAATADGATLTYRAKADERPRPYPRTAWRFADNGCSLVLTEGNGVGIYEVVYEAADSPVAGLGLAAVRDFGAYLLHGADDGVLRENPAALRRLIGFGYSLSARMLRQFVRDGFNADERGRQVFDAMMLASAGAGVGSFTHRFAMPEQSGNSVLSVLRPVDVPPFTDDGLLAKARASRTVPKIFYTLSSSGYWARAGALIHTDGQDGAALRDAPLDPSSRLYFLAGPSDVQGPVTLSRRTFVETFQHNMNFGQQRWVMRALLLDLDAWARNAAEPPPSRYPTIARGELVAREAVRFPTIPSLPFAPFVPPVWRMDFGADFATTGVIANEPPVVGAPYRVLVPQVDRDGNDASGIRLPEVAVPLGTFTGWNLTIPEYRDVGYLAGLVGAFEPFARTKEVRDAAGDARLSLAERYKDEADYLDQVKRAADALVNQRFLRSEDVPAVVARAQDMWASVTAAR